MVLIFPGIYFSYAARCPPFHGLMIPTKTTKIGIQRTKKFTEKAIL